MRLIHTACWVVGLGFGLQVWAFYGYGRFALAASHACWVIAAVLCFRSAVGWRGRYMAVRGFLYAMSVEKEFKATGPVLREIVRTMTAVARLPPIDKGDN